MDVSVVMPVGPRIADLPLQLRSLANQSWTAGFELILSANGVSRGKLSDAVDQVAWPQSVCVMVVDSSDKPGPSHARNVGWRRARAPYVLFCDADDVVHEHWVTEMMRALRRTPVVGGRLDYDRLNPPALSSWGRVSADALAAKFGHLPFAGSCNLGVRADVLDAVGGFDEELSASEDVDLCWRAQYLGFAIAMAPDAVVFYRRRSDFRSLFGQARNDARNDPALLRRHRRHGVRWSVADLAREVGGVGAAMIGSLASYACRLQLAARGGRLVGHLRALRFMLAS